MSYYNAGNMELFSVCCSTCAPNFKSGWMAVNLSFVISQIEQGYEHSQNWIDSSKIGALFLSLNLTPCLDGDVVILLMLETTDRVIWRAHDDDVVREIFLPPGYVKNTLNDVINFFSPPKNHD